MTMTHEQALAALTAPGAPFEMAEATIGGARIRVWKHAPASLRAILEATRAHGDLPFLVHEGERISYDAHYRAATALAHLLVERFGVAKGERVAIAMRNRPEWVIAFWAASSIGAVVVPLNAWWAGPELEYGLADCGASVLFADGERADRLAPHLAGLGLRAVVVAGAESEPGPGLLDFEALMAAAPVRAAPPEIAIAPEDAATIFYTSGTTGKPKGALGSHRNICSNVMSQAYGRARALLRRGEALPDPETPLPKKAMLLSVPLFHATGCHSTMVSVVHGGHKLVLMRRWDPERALDLIEAERITHFGGVPAVAWQIIESPSFAARDLSSVEAVAYGGAPSAPELVARLHQALPAAASGNGYGLTETSSITSQNIGVDYLAKPNSAGPPVPVCDVRVVNSDGAEVPTGETGELHIKGPNVVAGYWNDAAATSETFADGWLRTGDLVRLDGEGFIYIVDRAKDMLIRGGENVYCVEVEDALYSHPAVMDAAVVGLPHRVLGEEVGAAVQLTPGARAGEQELQDHVAERLAGFKVPVRIDLRDAPLPRNANGKILKNVIREELTGGPADDPRQFGSE